MLTSTCGSTTKIFACIGRYFPDSKYNFKWTTCILSSTFLSMLSSILTRILRNKLPLHLAAHSQPTWLITPKNSFKCQDPSNPTWEYTPIYAQVCFIQIPTALQVQITGRRWAEGNCLALFSMVQCAVDDAMWVIASTIMFGYFWMNFGGADCKAANGYGNGVGDGNYSSKGLWQVAQLCQYMC